MNFPDLTHGDPGVLPRFKDADPELVAEFLRIRQIKGKPNLAIRLTPIFRQLDRCITKADRDQTLENALCDNAHNIYDHHLPPHIRFFGMVAGNSASGAASLSREAAKFLGGDA